MCYLYDYLFKPYVAFKQPSYFLSPAQTFLIGIIQLSVVCFYPNYFNYTVSAFQTYVSDNPEKSTVHNYFLLLLSEQGIIGLILFCSFLFFVLKKAQESFCEKLSDSKQNLLIASTGSIFILLLHLMLNDLIEVDKIAAGFFLSCVIILKIEDIKED